MILPSFKTQSEIIAKLDLRLAPYFVNILASREWISRHRETITFLGRSYIERVVVAEVSIDALTSLREVSRWASNSATLPIPIALFSNGLEIDFDIWVNDTPVALATSNQSSRVALSLVAQMYKVESGRIPDSPMLNNMYAILTRTGFGNSDVTPELRKEVGARLDKKCVETRSILDQLAGKYLAIVDLPVDNVRTVTVRYRRVETWDGRRPLEPTNDDLGFRRKAAQLLGVAPRRIEIPIQTGGQSQRQHIFVHSPDGMIFDDAEIRRAGTDFSRTPTIADGGAVQSRTLQRVAPTKGSFYMRSSDGVAYTGWFRFRPCPSIGIYAAAAASLLMLSVSLCGVLGQCFSGLLTSRSAQLDVPSLITVMLLVPSAFLVFAIVSGENELQSHALERPRLIMFISVVAYYFAGLSLAMDGWHWTIVTSWILSCLFAGCSSFIFSAIIIAGRQTMNERRANGLRTDFVVVKSAPDVA